LITPSVLSKGKAHAFVFAASGGFFFVATTLASCLDHFSFLGSRFRKVAFFLHFEEQYQKVAASFRMNITPVPSGINLLQNEHLF
jgi:hypothetical protein